MTIKLLSQAETYSWDMPLFKKLGLKPFYYDRDIFTDFFFVGEVEHGKSYCKIWVCCMPSQSWKFEVYPIEDHKIIKVSTGSGSLSEYWDMVCKIMDGMLVIDSVEEKKNV